MVLKDVDHNIVLGYLMGWFIVEQNCDRSYVSVFRHKQATKIFYAAQKSS